jgi:hypothetical protein
VRSCYIPAVGLTHLGAVLPVFNDNGTATTGEGGKERMMILSAPPKPDTFGLPIAPRALATPPKQAPAASARGAAGGGSAEGGPSGAGAASAAVELPRYVHTCGPPSTHSRQH